MRGVRRVCAVVLPSFRVALVRARAVRDGGFPKPPALAVVVDSARSERDLTGGTRIDEVSSEARACGVLPGATIASARATCTDLRVRVLHPREATRALESLAEMLLTLGAITAPMIDRDTVLVDVTGCAHLHDGESLLLDAIVAMVASAGFSCRAVIASGPEIAWALAKETARSRVVADEDTMRALAELSIDVLRLDARTASYFYRLGVRTLGALRALPRSALTARIENQNLLARVRALLDGEDLTPIPRFVPQTVIEERAELEYGIEHHEALFFVLKTLCDRLSARLSARAALASRLEVVLELDRALLSHPASGDPRLDGVARTITVSLPLATALSNGAELLVVLRSRFEREPPLHAPALAIMLRAPELAPLDCKPRHLFVPESRAEIALPKLAAELAALMGEGTLGTLAIADDWRFSRRSVLVPFGKPWKKIGGTTPIEPLRLVTPEPVESWTALHHVARYERIVWWRGSALVAARDWKLAWHENAIAFIEESASGHARLRGFLD